MNRKITCLLLLAALVLPVFAEEKAMPRLEMPTAASDAFGGHHVAYTDNVFSLLVNPAAMIRTQQRSFFTIAPTVFNPQSTLELSDSVIDLVTGDTSALGKAMDVLGKREGKIALGVDLRELPLSVAWVANGFGFGVWNRTFVNANIIGTTVKADVYADLMLPVGFAFKILDTGSHTLDAGITLKPFARLKLTEQEEITSLIGNEFDFEDSLQMPVIAGGTFDVGLMYHWNGFAAGFTFNDIYSRGAVVANLNEKALDENDYYVPFTMNAGLSYEFNLLFLKFALAADWRNVANIFDQDNYMNRNAFLDLGLGLQVSIFNFIQVRAGMSDMLPALGVGLNLGAVKIDAAYYGKEFGNEPGQLSAAMLDLSISIRPGAKKRDWFWARNAIF